MHTWTLVWICLIYAMFLALKSQGWTRAISCFSVCYTIWILALQSSLSRLDLHLMHGDSILVQRTVELKAVPPILKKLVASLDLPKVKSSAKGKVLMCAMYGVKVETVFICSVFASAFSSFRRKLFDLNVDDKYFWAQALTGLQTSINSEIINLYSTGNLWFRKSLKWKHSRIPFQIGQGKHRDF